LRYSTSSDRYATEYEDEPRFERARHVPDDWQETWAAETLRVCDVVWRQWAFRMYRNDEQAREDLAGWLRLKAAECAARWTPKNEPDAFEHWGAHLHASLTAMVRWHWAEYVGATAYQENGKWRVAQFGSTDELLDRDHEHTMHLRARVELGTMWSWRPLSPEQYLRIVELAQGDDDDTPLKDPGLCSEWGCARPADTKGLCHGHYATHWRQWNAGTCAEPGCTELAVTKGACSMHYRQGRQDNSTVKRCIEPGCENAVRSRQLCDAHLYAYRRDGRELPPKRVPQPPAPCSVDGCDRTVLAKGMCSTHYHAARRAAS
jgi:hypothetical protein